MEFIRKTSSYIEPYIHLVRTNDTHLHVHWNYHGRDTYSSVWGFPIEFAVYFIYLMDIVSATFYLSVVYLIINCKYQAALSKICQFFNKMLSTGTTAESEVAEHIYDLILELHSIDSSVLLSVLPQLEFKLRVSACVRLLD